MKKPSNEALERGLPANVDAERLVLGAILLNDAAFRTAAGTLQPTDFSLEKHRRIFVGMKDLNDRGEHIDRVTVVNELMRRGQLESIGGMSYVLSLDEGLPEISNLDSYIRIVRDKSLLRQIIFASRSIALRCIEDGDPSQILTEAGAQFLAFAEQRSQSSLLTPKRIIEGEGGILRFLDRQQRTSGVKTGFDGFDCLTGGLKPGGLYILGARPRMGKTALALNIAGHIALEGDDGTVLIFSLEMSRTSLVDRLICSRAQVDTKHYESGAIQRDTPKAKEERSRIQIAANQLHDCDRLLIDDQAITTLQEIHSKIRQEQARRRVSLVILDYLQLLVGGDDRNRVAEVSRISRGLKVIAKDCRAPLLVLSQLSRECDKRSDPRPRLSDLRDSGSIEQDADVVAFLFREELYKPGDPNLQRKADLIIAKQRDGAEAAIPLWWFGETVTFREGTDRSDAN